MKKIVALVLSLVMVLGLATVAFADVNTTELKVADGYAVYAINGGLGSDSATVKFTKTVTGNAVAADGTVTYTADQYANDAATKVYWNEVDVSMADSKLVNTKTNTVVAYLKYAGTSATPLTTSAVATSLVKGTTAATPSCGEYAKDVVMIKGAAFEVDKTSATYAVLNGKFVAYNTAGTTAVPHTFTKANEVNKDGTVANVKCDTCKVVFNVTDDVTAMVTGYQALTFAPGYYALIGAAAPEAPSTDKVESAETFDAGIAMYVGMSVMAAAGSAVVLKKKD